MISHAFSPVQDCLLVISYQTNRWQDQQLGSKCNSCKINVFSCKITANYERLCPTLGNAKYPARRVVFISRKDCFNRVGYRNIHPRILDRITTTFLHMIFLPEQKLKPMKYNFFYRKTNANRLTVVCLIFRPGPHIECRVRSIQQYKLKNLRVSPIKLLSIVFPWGQTKHSTATNPSTFSNSPFWLVALLCLDFLHQSPSIMTSPVRIAPRGRGPRGAVTQQVGDCRGQSMVSHYRPRILTHWIRAQSWMGKLTLRN